jgi:A/G-specific adenine glycosylase
MAACHQLLSWYEKHRRALPWRTQPPDPYKVLVSEVMLQQTRVETALPYYERFMARFASVRALAEASEEEVMVHWAGLGYYRRARQLHQAAKKIVEIGAFPQTVETLLELPGIGPYTAAAVASIAFGLSVPVLDGNVLRVQSRRLGIREPRSAAERRRIDQASRELLVDGRAGDSNQALMELGATICRPSRPICGECPLSDGCLGRASGDPKRFPAPRRRRATERRSLVSVLVRDGEGRILLFRRPVDEELLPGSWELPWVEQETDSAADLGAALGARYGGRWSLGSRLGRARHQITHRSLRIELRSGELSGGGEIGEGIEGRWVELAQVATLARSSLVDKLLRGVGA